MTAAQALWKKALRGRRRERSICHVIPARPIDRIEQRVEKAPDILYRASTKHLYNICTMVDQRRRCWADVVQMLYKCFVFAGYPPEVVSTFSQLSVPSEKHLYNICTMPGQRRV